MAKIKDKELYENIKYVDTSLALIKQKLDDCNSYLQENPWKSKVEIKEREAEFKFQAAMFDNYFKWIKIFSEVANMVSTLKDLVGDTEEVKSVRKGSHKSVYAEMVKKGDFE